MTANTSFLKLMYRVLLISAGALFCWCSTQVAGPTTDEGNPQIIAVVIDTDGKSVAKASVSVLRMAPEADSTEDISSGVKVAVAETNDDGICRFANLVPGLYSIQGEDSAGKATGIKSNITINSQTAALSRDTIIVSEPGTIHGVVSRGGVLGNLPNSQLLDAFIQVKLREIDKFLVTDVDGKYSFINIPAGIYTILYYATDGFFTASRKDVAVASVQVTTIDTVFLKPFARLVPPKTFTASYDTSQGLVHFTWSRVEYENLRWYELLREDPYGTYTRVWNTSDTAYIDSIGTVSIGTTLYYMVRSVDTAFNRSLNAGPIEIKKAP